MAIIDAKITQSDITSHGIVAKPNKLPGPALANKRAFDELVREVVAARLNALVDSLLADTAAGEIGVDDTELDMGVQNVQEALKAIRDSIVSVSVPDGGITAEKLAAGAVTAAKLGSKAVTTAKLADGAVTAAKLALPIYVQAGEPTGASPDGVYLVTG